MMALHSYLQFQSSQVENNFTYSGIYDHSHKTAFSTQNHTWKPLLDTFLLHKCFTKSTQRIRDLNSSSTRPGCGGQLCVLHWLMSMLLPFLSCSSWNKHDNTGNWWSRNRRSDQRLQMYPAWKMTTEKTVFWTDDVQQTAALHWPCAAQDRMSVTMLRKWHHFYSTNNANDMQTRFLMTKQFKYILTYNGGVTGILWWHLIWVHYLSKCIFCWWGFGLLFFLHVGSRIADP